MLSLSYAVAMERHDRTEPSSGAAPTHGTDMLTKSIRALAALAGAVLLSQFPAFYDQYLQRLGGRLDQARIEIARIEDAARQERLSVEAYVAVFLGDAKSPVRRQGHVMQAQLGAFTGLEAAFAALRDASTAARPLRFASHVENDTARAALADFQPALPLGTEGMTYALIGMLGGLLGARISGRAISALARRRRRAA